MSRALSLFVSALAVALLVTLSTKASESKKDENTHEGTVVRVSDNKLVMKLTGEEDEHTHVLADDGRVTLDGRKCKLEDLKPGQKIRITTKKDDKSIAIKIEALDKNKDFGTKEAKAR